MANIKQTAEYDRRRAQTAIATSLSRWIPPEPISMVAETVDVTEAALKEVLPGYHVTVVVRRIESGLEG